jgi:Ion channel
MLGRLKPLARLQEWRFLQLTIILGIWMLLSPSLGDRWLLQGLMQFILLNSMLVTLWVGLESRRGRWLLLMLWGLAFAASLAVLLPIAPDYRELLLKIEIAARVPILTACAVGILTFVFRRGAVTLDGIFAAVAAYLLIAFAFADSYLFLQIWVPESFRLPESIATTTNQSLAGSMLYFSFVTIATLGYGDILPHSETARMLAVIEAVVGQFYVAVIVALLVSKLVAPRAPDVIAVRGDSKSK